MAPRVGDRLPLDMTLMRLEKGAPVEVPLAPFFANKTVVLFTIPGAFTSLCRTSHFPSFAGATGDALRAAGAADIVCIASNDSFVVDCFRQTMGTGDRIQVLADGDAAWARAAGMAVNLGKFGGVRCARSSFVVTDGVVMKAYIEDGPAYSGISGGKHMLANW
eukprot:TRINITY_DN319_c0_g1_i4.p3 TRINITY_DN319_c0_g1~~TRINITY_DN319_c0_g1_i4.p3  ORF type:complete len:163 (+),score=61.73 TRINITY_DN319_c0_g1_i4:552-1040(+)